MNEKQIGLIMEIIQEQLSYYLDEQLELAAEIMSRIAEAFNDNMPLLEDMGTVMSV